MEEIKVILMKASCKIVTMVGGHFHVISLNLQIVDSKTSCISFYLINKREVDDVHTFGRQETVQT